MFVMLVKCDSLKILWSCFEYLFGLLEFILSTMNRESYVEVLAEKW